MQETWVSSLGQEDPLEKMETHSGILGHGNSQGQRSLADYSSWGHRRIRRDSARRKLSQPSASKLNTIIKNLLIQQFNLLQGHQLIKHANNLLKDPQAFIVKTENYLIT